MHISTPALCLLWRQQTCCLNTSLSSEQGLLHLLQDGKPSKAYKCNSILLLRNDHGKHCQKSVTIASILKSFHSSDWSESLRFSVLVTWRGSWAPSQLSSIYKTHVLSNVHARAWTTLPGLHILSAALLGNLWNSFASHACPSFRIWIHIHHCKLTAMLKTSHEDFNREKRCQKHLHLEQQLVLAGLYLTCSSQQKSFWVSASHSFLKQSYTWELIPSSYMNRTLFNWALMILWGTVNNEDEYMREEC